MRRLTSPQFLFDVDETPTGEPAAVETPAVPAPAVPDAPWAQDLRQYVTDESAYAGADRYIREKAQPRITQLEQELASSKDARELYTDLTTNPAETYLAITAQLLGDDYAEELRARLEADEEPEPEAAPQAAELDPRVRALVEAEEARQQEAMYRDALDSVRERPGEPELVDDLFHPFVIAAEGDFDQARHAYNQWAAGRPGADAPAVPTTPPVLGSDTAATPPAATVKGYSSWGDLDAALNDAIVENRKPAPTVVGVA